MSANRQQLIVFARTPVEGKCKTRLLPLLGAHHTTEFYKAVLTHSVQQASQLPHTDITLCVTPDIKQPFLRQLTFHYTCQLQLQCGNDLGQRMYHALQHSLQQYERSILIGSDCLELNSAYLQQAFTSLNESDIVIGPATDGGYILIGGRTISSDIFSHTEWGSAQVLQQAIRNIELLKLNYKQLNPLNDIDTPDDFLKNQTYITQRLGQQYLK